MRAEARATGAKADLLAADEFKQLDHELWFAKRLSELLTAVFNGATDLEVRKARIRRAIAAGGLEATIVGKGVSGKTETVQSAFERLYGEPLEPHQSSRKAKATSAS